MSDEEKMDEHHVLEPAEPLAVLPAPVSRTRP